MIQLTVGYVAGIIAAAIFVGGYISVITDFNLLKVPSSKLY
jgi:hypothetical protein